MASDALISPYLLKVLVMGKKGVVAGVLVLLILGVAAITYLDIEGIVKLPIKLPWSDMAKKIISKVKGGTESVSTSVPSVTKAVTTSKPSTTSAVKTSAVTTSKPKLTSKSSITTTKPTTSVTKPKSVTTTLPKKLVGINVSKLRSIVQPKVVKAEGKAKDNILKYYEAVRKESLNITNLFDLNVVDEDSLIKLHKAFYEAYDIKKLRVSNVTCSFISADVIKCSYTVTITVVDKSGKSLTQVNNLVTFTNKDGLIMQTVPARE